MPRRGAARPSRRSPCSASSARRERPCRGRVARCPRGSRGRRGAAAPRDSEAPCVSRGSSWLGRVASAVARTAPTRSPSAVTARRFGRDRRTGASRHGHRTDASRHGHRTDASRPDHPVRTLASRSPVRTLRVTVAVRLAVSSAMRSGHRTDASRHGRHTACVTVAIRLPVTEGRFASRSPYGFAVTEGRFASRSPYGRFASVTGGTLRVPIAVRLRRSPYGRFASARRRASLAVTVRLPVAVADRGLRSRSPCGLLTVAALTVRLAIAVAVRLAVTAGRRTLRVAVDRRLRRWRSSRPLLPADGRPAERPAPCDRSAPRAPRLGRSWSAESCLESLTIVLSCVESSIGLNRTAAGVANGPLTRNGHPSSGGHSSMNVRRCPTLPQGRPCSTIGAASLSFRVRNVSGRFPRAMAAETRATPTLPHRVVGWVCGLGDRTSPEPSRVVGGGVGCVRC